MAAYYEFEVNRNPFKARKVFYKALKVNAKETVIIFILYNINLLNNI